MSKKRHKRKSENNKEENKRNFQQRNNSAGPFGINPAQLLSMLGNIDMNQLNTMLQNISRDGLDLNNMNLGGMQNILNGMAMNEDNINSKINANERKKEFDKSKEKTYELDDIDEDNIEFLKNLRNIVSEDRVKFIDKLINICNSNILKE